MPRATGYVYASRSTSTAQQAPPAGSPILKYPGTRHKLSDVSSQLVGMGAAQSVASIEGALESTIFAYAVGLTYVHRLEAWGALKYHRKQPDVQALAVTNLSLVRNRKPRQSKKSLRKAFSFMPTRPVAGEALNRPLRTRRHVHARRKYAMLTGLYHVCVLMC